MTPARKIRMSTTNKRSHRAGPAQEVDDDALHRVSPTPSAPVVASERCRSLDQYKTAAPQTSIG
jgi:hypothetical protein